MLKKQVYISFSFKKGPLAINNREITEGKSS